MKLRDLCFVGILALVTALSSQPAFSNSANTRKLPQKTGFPLGPNPELTPGKLCDKPNTVRYPEHIAYCERNVDTSTKKEIIKTYDIELGYKVETMNRADFKIDHYFPLCAGGSNDPENLWPQHKSVYQITDPLEPEVCNKMAQGRLLQVDAITLIIEAKNNLERAPEIIAYVKGL